jgi:hypothetical protein
MADWRTTANHWLFGNTNPTIRAFTKWYFDLVKNALVVAALWYTWKKTDDAIVGAVAALTFAMFLSYVLTYPLTVIYVMRPYIHSLSPLRSWLLGILTAIVIGGATYGIGTATMQVMAAIFRAQGSD